MLSRAYLQLLRVPNLFTVPGDPACGYLLASGGRVGWPLLAAIFISLAAYCAGLVTNDLADLEVDLQERPTRPLPSGAVPRERALGLALLLIAATLLFAALLSIAAILMAAGLLATVLLYNYAAKRHAITGPPVMGACRGLSVLVGVAAAGRPPTLLSFIAAAFVALYIAGVTVLARAEAGDPRIPPMVGRLIRALLFIQAGFCAAAGGWGWAAAALLLALWPLCRLVGSHFYAS